MTLKGKSSRMKSYVEFWCPYCKRWITDTVHRQHHHNDPDHPDGTRSERQRFVLEDPCIPEPYNGNWGELVEHEGNIYSIWLNDEGVIEVCYTEPNPKEGRVETELRSEGYYQKGRLDCDEADPALWEKVEGAVLKILRR